MGDEIELRLVIKKATGVDCTREEVDSLAQHILSYLNKGDYVMEGNISIVGYSDAPEDAPVPENTVLGSWNRPNRKWKHDA